MSIQFKAVVKTAKNMFDGIGKKYSQSVTEVVDDMKKKTDSMYELLHQNDGKIAKMKKQYEINDMKIQQQHYIVERQREIAEKEMRKLRELEAVETGMKKTNSKLNDEIEQVIDSQTRINVEYLKSLEKLAELESKEQEETMLLEAPKEMKPKWKKNKEIKSEYTLSVIGNIIEHRDIADNLRRKMHEVYDKFGEYEEVKTILTKNDLTLQYKYIDRRYVGNETVKLGTYYFKTSSEFENEIISMYKEFEGADKIEIKCIAESQMEKEKIFLPFVSKEKIMEYKEKIEEDNQKMVQYNEIARSALKSIVLLEESLKEREEKETVIYAYDNKEIYLKNA